MGYLDDEVWLDVVMLIWIFVRWSVLGVLVIEKMVGWV